MRLLVLAFTCGILFLQTQPVLPSPGLIAGLMLSGLACAMIGACATSWTRRLSLLVGVALLGFVWAGGRAQLRLSDELPVEWEVKNVQITGVIASLPQRFERGERFEFDVDSVQTSAAIVPRRIMLSWYHSWDDIDDSGEADVTRAVRPGERWRFTVRLKRPHGQANPSGFDYEAWLLERNIRATGTIRAHAGNERLDAFVPRPAYAVERLREILRHRFHLALPDAPYLGVLVALAVGDQRSIPAPQWNVFNRTGVTHLVSISGLHVTMIAALFAWLVNGLWRRSERLMFWLPAQKAAVMAGWLAALAYALLAGFEVPAQRTVFMLSVVALALWSGRNFGVSRTLLLALLAVLLFDPWAVLATGFWLSFGAVSILFYVTTARLGSPSNWQATLKQWGVTQWAVTVGSLPLLLLFFQQFSLVSPLANAVAIPVVSFVITPLALLFAVLPWTPLLVVDHWMLAQLMRLLETLAVWPVWQQPAPPLWASWVAVAGAFWLLLPRGFPSRWLGLCLLLPALFWPPSRPVAGEAWIDVLDVGQGLAVLVRTSQHALLYDTGPRYSAETSAGQRIVLPFLRAVGVQQLDSLVVSHRDKDHAGGLDVIREALPVERLVTSMPELGGEICVAGQSWEWDGVHFVVMHPDATDYGQKSNKPNNLSCVLRIEAGPHRVLLTADIEAKDEASLIRRTKQTLSSDVLIVPHHGGRGSSTQAFVNAVGARHAVFSAGYRNAFGHPRADILERYADSHRWRTDRDGAVSIRMGESILVGGWRSERQRYWYD